MENMVGVLVDEQNIQDNNIDADTLWALMLNDLQANMPTPAFTMAIQPLGVRSYNDNVLTLITNRSIWSKTIKERYSDVILNALKKYTKNPYASFKVIIDKDYTS